MDCDQAGLRAGLFYSAPALFSFGLAFFLLGPTVVAATSRGEPHPLAARHGPTAGIPASTIENGSHVAGPAGYGLSPMSPMSPMAPRVRERNSRR